MRSAYFTFYSPQKKPLMFIKAKKGLRPKFFITFCERFFIQMITKLHTARKEKFSIKDFFSKCDRLDQIIVKT